MSTLREDVTGFLATRRAMGFKVEGLSKLLLSFAAFCEARGATRVHNDLAVEWATTTIKVPVNNALSARRMDAVRIFARYQHALDSATQIPPEAIRNRRYQPREPNVFSEAEVLALLAATGTLSPQFKAVTWRTLIGLLAATGMRPGEVCHLNVNDIDLANGVIQVLETKFGKSRLVFIHPTTATVVGHYLQVRQDWAGITARACPALFVNNRRQAINPGRLGCTFTQITAAAGITTEPGHRPPRLLSRPGARFRCCHRPVSPDRSPNPPCQSPGNGLSTVPAVTRDSQVAMGTGSCFPGRRSGRPSRFRAGNTRSRPP